MERYYFLRTETHSRGTSLVTLPGQMLTRSTPLTPGIIVKGVDKIRHAYPVGTVFCCTELRRSSGCYTARSVTPIMTPDGESMHLFLYSEIYLKEYDRYLQSINQ